MGKKNRCVIIVAGGRGERMGSVVPKQFLLLNGKPVLMYTIEAFLRFDPAIEIIVVLPEDQQKTWANLCAEHAFCVPFRIVSGGETRYHSVKNALALISKENELLVGIHDGVRPLVSGEVIGKCFEAAEHYPAVVPVIPVSDSIRELDLHSGTSHPVDRQCYRLIQTPQVFQSEILLKAYSESYIPQFTDDASVVGRMSDIHLVDGSRDNIKITTPEDLVMAEALLTLRK